MLRSLNELVNYRLIAADGDVGKIRDLYFDDAAWVIRYLVADTGSWLSEREVLLSPESIRESDWTGRQLHVNLTKDQIEKSPPVERDQPVSRRREKELVAYYGWPMYWGAPMGAAVPAMQARDLTVAASEKMDAGDPHLRSVREVCGYHIEATDGSVGHVDDFIATDEDWMIRYMVVDTRNWLPGRKVLIAPWMIQTVDWANKSVQVSLNQEKIKGSPEFDPAAPVNRAYEARYYDYHGRPAYWST